MAYSKDQIETILNDLAYVINISDELFQKHVLSREGGVEIVVKELATRMAKSSLLLLVAA